MTDIYLLTPPGIADLDAFARQLDAVLGEVYVAALQIRLKDVAREDVKTAFQRLAPIARSHETVVILNDDAQLAKDLRADGVHLGQSDMDVKQARKLLGPDVIIGATAHNSRHLAMQAGEAGADYVAFGAFYTSATKKTEFVATPDLLTWWAELFELPCVAIGGITPANAAPLAQAGADFIAVSGCIWNADDPVQAIAQLARASARTRE